MAIPAEMKDTKTFVMVAGLDRSDSSAQEFKFDGDHLCVATIESPAYLAKRLDWTSGSLDYVGLNASVTAATSATTWQVWKYTWTSSNLTLKQGPLTGSWDGRAALAWS